MPLILLHLLENRKLKGSVIQTVSMGYLPGRIAKQFGSDFEEVPVGFKHIAKRMGETKVLFGGEESGGYGIGLWSPERDGLLCALLLLEMLAKKKKPLSVLVDDMYAQFGQSYFKRVDFPISDNFDKTAWMTHITSILGTTIANTPIKNVMSTDGLKIVTENDSWFLMRPSGTEPLIRTYAEASSQAQLDALINEAGRLANTAPPSPKKIADDLKKAAKKKKAAAASAK